MSKNFSRNFHGLQRYNQIPRGFTGGFCYFLGFSFFVSFGFSAGFFGSGFFAQGIFTPPVLFKSITHLSKVATFFLGKCGKFLVVFLHKWHRLWSKIYYHCDHEVHQKRSKSQHQWLILHH